MDSTEGRRQRLLDHWRHNSSLHHPFSLPAVLSPHKHPVGDEHTFAHMVSPCLHRRFVVTPLSKAPSPCHISVCLGLGREQRRERWEQIRFSFFPHAPPPFLFYLLRLACTKSANICRTYVLEERNRLPPLLFTLLSTSWKRLLVWQQCTHTSKDWQVDRLWLCMCLCVQVCVSARRACLSF